MMLLLHSVTPSNVLLQKIANGCGYPNENFRKMMTIICVCMAVKATMAQPVSHLPCILFPIPVFSQLYQLKVTPGKFSHTALPSGWFRFSLNLHIPNLFVLQT
jgi:hypothetical protein